jgi:hypothetical protein
MSWKAPGPTPRVFEIRIAHPIPTILEAVGEGEDNQVGTKARRKGGAI